MTELYKRIADMVDEGDDKFDGTEGVGEAAGAENASPRAWGFDVDEINRSYALAIWGGKVVVVNEQPAGPVNDRVRVMSVESMNSWFANRFTEIVGSDGRVRPVTWAKAWHSHRDRRQYDGVEFFPNPDGAPSTPNYLNFWRGFDVMPSPAGSYNIFRDHLLTNVCDGDPDLFQYVFGWMAHIVQKPRERLGTAIVLRGGAARARARWAKYWDRCSLRTTFKWTMLDTSPGNLTRTWQVACCCRPMRRFGRATRRRRAGSRD
jgi:hypothetical protein